MEITDKTRNIRCILRMKNYVQVRDFLYIIIKFLSLLLTIFSYKYSEHDSELQIQEVDLILKTNGIYELYLTKSRLAEGLLQSCRIYQGLHYSKLISSSIVSVFHFCHSVYISFLSSPCLAGGQGTSSRKLIQK